MKKNEITNVHEEIVKVLVSILSGEGSNKVISYSDLCNRLHNEVSYRGIAKYLGDISCWSKEIGAPMISVMVVNKESFRPGNGFFELYSELYGIPKKAIDKERIFVEELNKVLRYKKWNNLKFYLGI